MSEIRRLLIAYDTIKSLGKACALATVVSVEGSSYRRPGARMLVSHDGQISGSISGGCLEGDALKRAQYCMLHNKPTIAVYDSTDREEDLGFGAQLGCQGKIQIYIEPVDFNASDNPLEFLRKVTNDKNLVVLSSVLVSSDPTITRQGGRMLVSPDGSATNRISSETPLQKQLEEDALDTLQNGSSKNQTYTFKDQRFQVFHELISPAPILSIFGAGNDVQPLCKMASRLGWRVHIRDGRMSQAVPDRFPEAETVEVVNVQNLENLTTISGFVLLMSHNYNYDLAVLKVLSGSKLLKYIGILGPKKRTNFLLEDLSVSSTVAAWLNEIIYGPVGIDIGAETPEEISIAIMAELISIEKGHTAGFLSKLDRPIHPRPAENSILDLR